MAVPPTTEEAFIREVDEELRRDTLKGFWKKWGRLLVGGLIVALAAFGGWLWWTESRATLAGTQGEELTRAVDSLAAGNVDAAAKALKPLETSDIDGHRALARLSAAAIAVQKGNMKAAADGFAAIAKDEGLAKPWRDLALVRQTATEFDSLKPDVVIDRLKPLTVKGNPWFGSAGELVAMAHLKAGKADLAGAMFAAMAKDEDVPETIRSRALQMAGTLGVDAVITPAKADKE